MTPQGELHTQTDEQLFGLYLDEQNQAAFAVLYDRHSKTLDSWVDMQCLFENGCSEDVVQNVFIAVHTKKDSYDRAKPFLPWLRRIATHEAINYGVKTRRQKRGGQVIKQSLTGKLDGFDNQWSTAVDPVAQTDKISLAVLDGNGDPDTIELLPAEIYECLSKLPEQHRLALVYTFYDGLSERDCAKELGVSRYAARNLITEALKLAQEIVRKAAA